MENVLITGGDIYTPEACYERGVLLIEDGRIIAVGPAHEGRLPTDEMAVINAKGLLVVPGFIDLQINGGFGHDFSSEPSTIPFVAERLPQTGVTAFCPTLLSSPGVRYAEAIAVAKKEPRAGAHVLGLHFEGPYLNPQRAGAHDPRWIRRPDEADEADGLACEQVRLVTLAPELPGAERRIRALRAAGIVVAAGHSEATYEQAQAAFDAGITYVTHLFNAMSPWHHRRPGLAGAALDDERVRVGLIVDGIHVHPATVRLVWRAKGPQGITLVTDAIAAMGQPAGSSRLGDWEIRVEGGVAQLSDGTLAGSMVSMDQSVRNLMDFTGCSLSEALRAASTTPAAVLELDHRKGRLAPGYDADVVLLRRDLSVAGTIVGGNLVYWAAIHTRPTS